MALDLLPSPFPPAALGQLDHLDGLLADYLAALDLYHLAQERLAHELKQVRSPARLGRAALPPPPSGLGKPAPPGSRARPQPGKGEAAELSGVEN